MTQWIEPDWPAPQCVRAISTQRIGGVSTGCYASLNLGDHVGDDPTAVDANRRRITSELALPSEPSWLRQVHGVRLVEAGQGANLTADGSFSREAGQVCAVMTADCLPVLLCSISGDRVAAVHCGWRGLAAGILGVAVAELGAEGLMAWLGPAIGPDAFEVGADVLEIFLSSDSGLGFAFAERVGGRWTADLYGIASRQLATHGVEQCYGGGFCTFRDQDRFFSYRRDGITGRMATFIWID